MMCTGAAPVRDRVVAGRRTGSAQTRTVNTMIRQIRPSDRLGAGVRPELEVHRRIGRRRR